MLKLLPFLFLLVTTIADAKVSIPSQYVQQNQHTSFLIFGNGGQSLTSHCFFVDEPAYGRCYLEFQTDELNKKNIFFDFDVLRKVHPSLVRKLKKLQARWEKDHPVTPVKKYIFLFREHDQQTLAGFIASIENEFLSYRFLMPNTPREIESIHSAELVAEIFKVFEEALSPYELR